MRVVVPEFLGLLAKLRAQAGVDLLSESRQQTISPHLPEGRIVQFLDSGNLQLQASVLAGVAVNAVHMLGAGQNMIQSIATSRGDDEHRVLGGKLERFQIQARVLPAFCVNESNSAKESRSMQVEVECE